MSEKSTPSPDKERTPFFRFARFVLAVLSPLFFPFKVHGGERLSAEAPYLIVSNHMTMLDPLAIGMAIKRYEIRFLGKSTLRKNPVLRWILDHLHMIPVVRHGTDMVAMRACLKALKDGYVLGIFPEGTRKEKVMMEEVNTGAALIALRSRVRVLPAYFDRKLRPFRRTNIYVGDWIETADLAAQGVDKASCEALTKRIYDATYRLKARSEAAT